MLRVMTPSACPVRIGGPRRSRNRQGTHRPVRARGRHTCSRPGSRAQQAVDQAPLGRLELEPGLLVPGWVRSGITRVRRQDGHRLRIAAGNGPVADILLYVIVAQAIASAFRPGSGDRHRPHQPGRATLSGPGRAGTPASDRSRRTRYSRRRQVAGSDRSGRLSYTSRVLKSTLMSQAVDPWYRRTRSMYACFVPTKSIS